MSVEPPFSNGDRVEVVKRDNFSIWFPAAVLRTFVRKNHGAGQMYVEFETLCSDDDPMKRRKEYVDLSVIRPAPPHELCRYFRVGESADVLYENRGWRRGIVKEILENSMYVVGLGDDDDGEKEVESVKVEQWQLRVHRDWKDGCWVPPLDSQLDQQYQQKKSEDFLMTPSGVKLRIKCNLKPTQEGKNNKGVAATKFDLARSSSDVMLNSKVVKVKSKRDRKALGPKFSKGMMVEATSFEEGYQGSWYTAVIFDCIGPDKFLLEYQTLRTDDESELLKEKADAFNIRPCPPVIQRIDRFKMFEQVDAWYNDGWWEGLISKVLDGPNYVVYFWTTNEEIEFAHYGIRPHQEWIDGKWDIIAFRKSNKLPNPKPVLMKRRSGGIVSETTLCIGAKVEVKDGEEGNQGCWYPALILRLIGNVKYLVEFRTLKCDFGTDLLVEEADALAVRPSAPILQRADRFRPLEEVDAWTNNCWRAGQVCEVLEGAKYRVYFWTTNEILEFRHHVLRPHQDWINGAWVGAKKG